MTLLALFALYAVLLSIGLARAGYRSGAVAAGSAPARRPSRVLIVGANGGTGRQLTLQALERGYSITALVRDPSRLGIEHPKLTVVRGDVLDARSVAAAIAGQDAVVSALGHRRYFGPTRILSDGTRHILQAMAAEGVPRLVCETSLGLGTSAGRMGLPYTFFILPVILPFYFWDKTRQERLIAASAADWIIVRPGALTNGPKRGRVRHGRDLGSFLWTVRISRADVASFMLDQLESDAYRRDAVGVAW